MEKLSISLVDAVYSQVRFCDYSSQEKLCRFEMRTHILTLQQWKINGTFQNQLIEHLNATYGLEKAYKKCKEENLSPRCDKYKICLVFRLIIVNKKNLLQQLFDIKGDNYVSEDSKTFFEKWTSPHMNFKIMMNLKRYYDFHCGPVRQLGKTIDSFIHAY